MESNKTEITPWPAIIVLMVGVILIIYTAVGPNITHNNRIFGVILLLLWTLLWSLLLWIIWREYKRETTWWVLLIPMVSMILFFVLIIAMGMGKE